MKSRKTNGCVPWLILAASACSGANYGQCPSADSAHGISGGKKDIAEIESLEDLQKEEKNPKSQCEQLTYRDDARLLLDKASATSDKEIYSDAARILVRLVELSPELTDQYGQLAAAYAGAGGVELLSFLPAMISSSGGIFEMGKDNLSSPDDEAYDANKENLHQAVYWIDEKIIKEAEQITPKADLLQSTIYRMAETLTIANGFLIKTEDGSWDQSAIDQISEEDVDAIIDNLDSIAAQIPDPQAKEKLATFQNSSGLSDEEKKELLRNALAERQ